MRSANPEAPRSDTQPGRGALYRFWGDWGPGSESLGQSPSAGRPSPEVHDGAVPVLRGGVPNSQCNAGAAFASGVVKQTLRSLATHGLITQSPGRRYDVAERGEVSEIAPVDGCDGCDGEVIGDPWGWALGRWNLEQPGDGKGNHGGHRGPICSNSCFGDYPDRYHAKSEARITSGPPP